MCSFFILWMFLFIYYLLIYWYEQGVLCVFFLTLCLIRLITEQCDYLRVSWKDVVHQALVAWLQSRNTATTTWAYTSMWKLLHFIHVLQQQTTNKQTNYIYITTLKCRSIKQNS